MNPRWLTILNREVIACTLCPRLVAYREQIARDKRRAYLAWDYWGKPVPGFGDPNACVLIMGLAPGAHGSNRTGRPFTGDASGNFMYPILYETGFANQPIATDRNDGLVLTDIYITAAARCAPPDNKPNPDELEHCRGYLVQEMEALENVKVVLALGKIGFDAFLRARRDLGRPPLEPKADFWHGNVRVLPEGGFLVSSYHPSQQNTSTGKLTPLMWAATLKTARNLRDRI